MISNIGSVLATLTSLHVNYSSRECAKITSHYYKLQGECVCHTDQPLYDKQQGGGGGGVCYTDQPLYDKQQGGGGVAILTSLSMICSRGGGVFAILTSLTMISSRGGGGGSIFVILTSLSMICSSRLSASSLKLISSQ